MFKEVDVDGNGLLDPEELKQLTSKLGLDLTEDQVTKVMAEIDADGSGEVDFEEFFDWYVDQKDKKGGLLDSAGEGLKGFFTGMSSATNTPTKEQRRIELHEEARAVFDSIDQDGNGELDLQELKELAEALGVKLDDASAQEAMATMDADGSGEVDFDEFIEWFVENKDKKGGLFGGLKTSSGLFGGAGSKLEGGYATEGATVGGVTPHTCILQWRVGGQSASPPIEFQVQQGGMLGAWNAAGVFDLASVRECERGEGWHQCEVGGLAAGKRYQFRIRVRGEEGWGGFSKGFTGYTEEQSAGDAAAEAKHPMLALLVAATEDNETPIPPETMESLIKAVTDHPLLTEVKLQMMDFVLKMMDDLLEMMDFLLK